LHSSDRLAELSAAMRRREEAADPHDGRFAFLAAVCHLAARRFAWAEESAGRAARHQPEWQPECAYLQGWAALLRGEAGTAVSALEQPAQDGNAPSQAHAQALLGTIAFGQGRWEEAIAGWKGLDPARRAQWGLEEPLRGTLFLQALQEFQEGRFDEAAERLREAGRLGWRDRRLGPLLTLALVKAGQQLLYSS
jgi:tetratricopeptide (TPR) repeat protein